MIRKKSLIWVVGGLLACVVQYFNAGWGLDHLVNLDDTVAIGTEGGASITPSWYGARAAVPSLGVPTFRLSENEPFAAPTGPFDRFMIPADRVHGTDRVRVQVRYKNLLGLTWTSWHTVDIKRALSRARTLFSHEFQWVEVRDLPGGGVDLEFSERTDPVATVTYSIEGGPQNVVLAPGQTHVTLAARPSAFIVELRTIDGGSSEQRIADGKMDFTYRGKQKRWSL